ncbi:transglycosylase domain-containing protein [Trichlorobacter sp.]|uniref:transglycosylase domain-containing protein n=1 Tax=Trichlorobacter sp. TaxID=2911007 RepID=UPI0039B9868D
MRSNGYLQRLLFACLALCLLSALVPSPGLAQTQPPPPYASHPLLPSGYRSIKVFDRQSRFVGRLLPETRYWVTIDRIPLFLQQAVVAVEDARFYEHGGIDLRGIARAAVKDVVKRRLAEGGSTITQQLIKNRYLSAEKTIDRKLKEGVMALEYEKQYTKRQILEMYLNEIYYGNGAWGIAQAARLYFDKNPEQLSDAECALLAGVPKNPGRYNPLAKPAEVAQRRAVVLKRMSEVGVLTARQLQQVRSQTVAPVPRNQAPYYLAHLRALLIGRYGSAIIEQGGLELTTALDLPLQLQAEQVISEGVPRIAPQLQGALVALDPVSGDLLALVGGTNFVTSPYNRALQARRQPGSAIKPLLYAFALESGARAGDVWNDAPVSYPKDHNQTWKPLNYDGKSHGDLSLRQALASSNNVIAVKLLDAVGVNAFSDFSAGLGLPLHTQHDLSLALGTEEVTLHDLALAYAPLANGGNRPQPRSIIRSYNSYHKSWDVRPSVSTPVMSPANAYITTQMLKDVLVSGTARSLKPFSQQYPAAGKTGTTNDYRDAWFIGYTPQLVAGVWLGYDQPKPGGKGFTGGVVAAPLWERFMRAALANRPVVDFAKPDTVVMVSIDPASGLLAGLACPRQRDEYFASGNEPAEYCPLHGSEPAPALTTAPNGD